MRVLVAAWAGSTNLGDELVLAGMLRQVDAVGLQPVVVSVDPAGTRAVHGVEAVPPSALLGELRRAGGLVLGGGGLLQDETSAYNLPYHLSRVWAARALRRPVVGVGLGAGRLDTAAGRLLVRRSLAGVPLSVRDDASAELLAATGLPRPVVAADLALGLRPVDVPVSDVLAVCLRPWSAERSSLVPASLRARTAEHPAALVEGWARALDDVATATGLRPRLVALQADRDGPLHDAVAARMRTAVELVAPDLAGIVPAVADARAVVSVRYHGGVAAVLAGRPAVLVGYSPKVEALAGELGTGGALLPWAPDGPSGLLAAVRAVVGRDDAVRAARASLHDRAARSAEVLGLLRSAG